MKKILNFVKKSKIFKNESKKIIKDIKNKNYEKDDNISVFFDLINLIDIPLIVLKKNNIIKFLNEAAINTFKLTKYNNLFYSFRRPEFRDQINSFRTKKIRKFEFATEIFTAPNSKFYNVQLYKLTQNNILLTFSDITRINRLETLRTDFIGNVSHELKTPLATLINSIELFKSSKLKNKEKNNLHKIMAKETEKMKLIIQDLLNLTKIENEQEKEIRETVNLYEIIKQSILEQKSFTKKNSKKIIYKGVKKSEIIGDRSQLLQMFSNIINNSIKYSKKESNLLIQLTKKNNKFFLNFQDKGKGIPSSLLPRLTERFYRVPESKIKNIEGSGLGLAIVKHIAIRHKAELKISSKLNSGTTVQLIFKSKGIYRADSF